MTNHVDMHAVVASRRGEMHLRGHHSTEEGAKHALARSIDSDPLQVIPAKVVIAANGNVRLWTTR